MATNQAPDAAPETAPETVYTEPDDEQPSKAMDMESGSMQILSTRSSVRDMKDTRTKGFVVMVAIAAALGGLIFGYDIGGAGMLVLLVICC